MKSGNLLPVLLFCASSLGVSACGQEEAEGVASETAVIPAAKDAIDGLREPINQCPIEAYGANGLLIEQECEWPPPPPPTPPAQPYSISYPVYAINPSLAVNWAGSGDWDTYYELEEQQNNGYWQPRYQGGGGSDTRSGLSSASYRYRVRACNSYGCSNYTTGPNAVVELAPVVDLYAEYPFLYAHDQQNAQYAAQSQGFSTGFKAPGAASPLMFGHMDLVDGKFHLGQGFDLLDDDYAQICVDTANPNFQVVSNPVNTRGISVTRAVTLSHLSQLLDVNMSGGLSLGLDGFSLDVTGSRKRFTEQISDSYQEYVVVRWERKLDHWTLNTAVSPLKADFASTMLMPNNPNAQNRFRERCGDKYVYAATRGARFYLVFRFDARNYSQTDRDQKAAALTLKIDDILDANGSASVSQETQQFLAALNVSVKAYAVGGDSNFEVGLSRDNFATRFQGFVDSVTASNVAAVEQSLAHYDQPASLLNYNYFQIFADYRVPLEQLGRWNAIDIEREQRCKLGETHGYAAMRSNCGMGAQELMSAKRKCLETASWSQCLHPLSYYPTNVFGSVPSGTRLYDWLGWNITSLERSSASQYFNHHVSGSWGNKKCQSFTDDTCLPSSSCMRDLTQGSGIGLGKGFDYAEHMWDGPGNGSGKSTFGLNQCVRTQSTLCSSQFGDTTADYQFTQTVIGQCPVTRSFAIVN